MHNEGKAKDMNALIGVIAIAVGLLYGIATWMLPRAVIGNPMSPLYFPLILAVSMCILGILLVLKSNIAVSIENLKAFKNRTAVEKKNNRQILFTCLLSLVYALIFDHVGYVIATFFFMECLLFMTNGKEKWLINTIVAAGFSIAIYIIFKVLLGIVLPPIPFLYL